MHGAQTLNRVLFCIHLLDIKALNNSERLRLRVGSYYRKYCDSLPLSANMRAEVFASKNKESVSPMSSTVISARPDSLARMEAGVRSCKAYLCGTRDATGQLSPDSRILSSKHLTHLNDVLTPSSASFSKASS